MSLWNWLLAAWIYEELFEDNSRNRFDDNHHNRNSLYHYDDYDDYDDCDDF